jgi:glycerol uptake facilitator-like aquaporin
MEHHSDNKFLIGEFFGCGVLLYTIANTTDISTVAAILGVLTVVIAPISGAHLNPAVTAGLHFAYGDESTRVQDRKMVLS